MPSNPHQRQPLLPLPPPQQQRHLQPQWLWMPLQNLPNLRKPLKKEGEPKVNPPSTDVSTDDTDEESAKREFSQVEVDLLQSLAKRRPEAFDDWAKQVQLKENMLVAVEGRIDEKANNLEKMKKEVEVLLAKYNEQEDTKIRSLVKIYESMKPKDAARIFEELDMPVLLMVVDRMSERKVGAGPCRYVAHQSRRM